MTDFWPSLGSPRLIEGIRIYRRKLGPAWPAPTKGARCTMSRRFTLLTVFFILAATLAAPTATAGYEACEYLGDWQEDCDEILTCLNEPPALVLPCLSAS